MTTTPKLTQSLQYSVLSPPFHVLFPLNGVASHYFTFGVQHSSFMGMLSQCLLQV
jgi:hypothetical protein